MQKYKIDRTNLITYKHQKTKKLNQQDVGIWQKAI